MRPLSLAALALSVLLGLGCAWKAHVKQGDAFLAAGDYDAAAL